MARRRRSPLYEALADQIWWDWSLALNRTQLEEALTEPTLLRASEQGADHPTVRNLVRDDLSRWILGCSWTDDESHEEYFRTALYHMAEEKGITVQT